MHERYGGPLNGRKKRKTWLRQGSEDRSFAVHPGTYVSHELGRAVKWDPKKEAVIGDDMAHKALYALPYRGDWKI